MEANTYSLLSMSQSPKEEADVLIDMINIMIHARTGSKKRVEGVQKGQRYQSKGVFS